MGNRSLEGGQPKNKTGCPKGLQISTKVSVEHCRKFNFSQVAFPALNIIFVVCYKVFILITDMVGLVFGYRKV